MDGSLVVTLSIEKVNAMLEHLYSVPIPHRYSDPLIRMLREAVEGVKNPPSEGDHQ